MRLLFSFVFFSAQLICTAQAHTSWHQESFDDWSAISRESRESRFERLGISARQQANQIAPIWSNDINNCTDWVFGNGSSEAGAPWQSIDINFECSTEGPAGFYNQWAGGTADGSAAPSINSTTADNGFLMVDSDLFGADANYDANWVENCWVQTAQPIDCSMHEFVSISMQTRYRCWDNGGSDGSEKCFIEISRDGTTWPSLSSAYATQWQSEGLVNYGNDLVQCRFNVFPESETGFQTDNPSFLEFDITEAAGNQETIWVRFRWVGTWGYSWEIDDIEVYETPANDTRIDNYVSFSNYAQTRLYEYGAWAQSQIPADLTAAAKVYNVGYQDQTNVKVDLDVNGTGYQSSTLATLGSASNDTLTVAYQPSGFGVQNLTYQVSSDAVDENPANNVFTQSFEVTELQYGRDNGVVTANFPGDGTDDFIAMPLYDIVSDVTIYGIDVAIMEGSETGTPIRAFLVDMFDPNALDFQYGGELISSEEVDLVSGYANDGFSDIVWYTLPFEQPYQASAGQWLGAAFEHYGGASLQIGEAQYTYDQTAFVYGPFGAGDAYNWYYSNEVPMVRLNLDPNISAQDPGCTDDSACNYDPSATVDDGSCISAGTPCDDGNANTFNDAWSTNCLCSGVGPDCSSNVDFGSSTFGSQPDLGSSFLPGCLGNQYLDVWHVLTPTYASDIDATYPSTLSVDSLDLVSFTFTDNWTGEAFSPGQIGLSFLLDNNGDSGNPTMFLGGTQYCISLYGTPTRAGSYNLRVDITSWSTIFSPFNAPFILEFALDILDENCQGCTDPLACNYDAGAFQDNGNCNYLDECGVCGGLGIPAGDCDCSGNQPDAIGVCAGTCEMDNDNNGVCDNDEVYGCMYPPATNYNSNATRDDGTCLFPCDLEEDEGCGFVYDGSGDGTVGTPDLLGLLTEYGQSCEDLCESDADGDGTCDDEDDCVGEYDECGVCNGPGPTVPVIESIEVLYDSVYAEQIDQWLVFEVGADTTFSYTCEALEPVFQACGDPVSYQGYDYATVLIGEQCWFAENLRSENYQNGDLIPSNLNSFEQGTNVGSVIVYGQNALQCQDYSPDIDACDPTQSLSEYGRLYNWFAIDDSRGLCPGGWHVPSDGEWTLMTDFLGGENVAGGQMKATYGWNGSSNGTNSSGFLGLPGGKVTGPLFFYSAGENAHWWSSTPVESYAWLRYIDTNENVYRHALLKHAGYSVRCIKDAE